MRRIVNLETVEYVVAGAGQIDLGPGLYQAIALAGTCYLAAPSAGGSVPVDGAGNYGGWPIVPATEPTVIRIQGRDSIAYYAPGGATLYLAQLEE